MKEWELGIYDIEAARKRGKDLWWEKTGGVGDLREFQDGAIADAAVKKVVGWLEKKQEAELKAYADRAPSADKTQDVYDFSLEGSALLRRLGVMTEIVAELKQEVGL